MSFLAPLFLLGAFAIALPIIFHLIRRSSRERLPFSSLMFLAPTPPKVTRRSRLEHLILLLLRCLVLLILALGFARPFFKKPAAPPPLARDGKQMLVLIDTSASMRRQNLWATAQAKAEEVLGRASLADQVAVSTFDREVKPLVSFAQWSSMEPSQRKPFAVQAIAAAKPSWAATYLGNALTRAAELFDEREKNDKVFERRQIILISDLQEGSRMDGLQGYEWPRGIEVMIEPVAAKKTSNAGLQMLADIEEAEVAVSSDAGLRVRISNSADSKREQFQVQWEGVVGATPVDVYVPPGQSRIIPAPKAPESGIADRLVLAGDDDDFDNRVYVLQSKPRQVHVLYFGNEAETDPAEPLYYLKRAFQQTRRQAVQIHSYRPDATVPETNAENANLIIVANALPDAQVKLVQKSLARGRVALVMVKNVETTQSIASLAGLGSVVAEEIATARYAMFGEINFEHPLFSPFADPRFSDFTKIHFWKHRRIETDSIPNARVLARFDDGAPAIFEVPAAKGVLLVLASGWHPADSQLALSSKFVPLLYSMLEQSSGPKLQRAQYWIGDPVVLPLETGGPITVGKPDNSKVEVPAKEAFSQTDAPGIYTMSGASAEDTFRFAVNLDAAETKTAPISADTLERLGVPLQQQPRETVRQTEEKRLQLLATELERQQQLWRWLVISALLILIAETGIAGWTTRRAQNFQAAIEG